MSGSRRALESVTENCPRYERVVQDSGRGSLRCNIPAPAADFLGLTAGDEVVVEADAERGELRISLPD